MERQMDVYTSNRRKMIDLIELSYANDNVFTFLVYYYLDQISDPCFEIELANDIKLSHDERLSLCQHMAAWLPYEKHYEEILQHISELIGAA